MRRALIPVVVVGYAGLAAATRRYTAGAGIAVLIAGAGILAIALRERPQPAPVTGRTLGWLAWGAVAAAAVAWSMLGLLDVGPHHVTLSSLAAPYLHAWAARAAALTAWLGIGVALARGGTSQCT